MFLCKWKFYIYPYNQGLQSSCLVYILVLIIALDKAGQFM